MARRKRVLKRPEIKPDKTYNSELVTRFINRVMWSGKKTTASKIVVNALQKAAEELKITPLEAIEKAVENAKPRLETKSVRVGGANFQVPMEPYPARQLRMAITWIINAARDIKGKPMSDKLSSVLVLTYNEQGPAIDKRNIVHQMAAANKAYAHLAMRGKKKAKK
jgi:small subunit ribosomal protein S7